MNVSEIGLIRLKNLMLDREQMTESEAHVVKREVKELLNQYFILKSGDVNVLVQKNECGYDIVIDAKAYDVKSCFCVPKGIV